MIYLDNSATTKPNAACVQAMTRLLCDTWGNPSSVHELGIAAERELKNARKEVAASLGAEPDRVFFTSGGTEADNWAIFSTCERLKKRGKHIVTTAVEHHAVLHPMKALEAKGFEVTYLQPDEAGFVCADALKAALRPDTILVSHHDGQQRVGRRHADRGYDPHHPQAQPAGSFSHRRRPGLPENPLQGKDARRGPDFRLGA